MSSQHLIRTRFAVELRVARRRQSPLRRDEPGAALGMKPPGLGIGKAQGLRAFCGRDVKTGLGAGHV
jgi:hypothetical protein